MNGKYWEEDIETMPRERLRELQLQRLKKTIAIAAHSPYYKKVFQEHGITPDSIQTVEDIRKIPFTTKADMKTACAYTPPAGLPAPLRSSSTRNTTWTLGQTWWHAASIW